MKEVDIDFNGLDVSQIDMNLKTLYYFIVVAETGNITRAAQKLYVTQSMLSKNIMALEERMGLPLFERSSRDLRLTRSGRYLYIKWKDMIIQYQREIEQAELMASAKVEKLRVGCFPLMDVISFLTPYMENVHARYPEISIEILRMNYNRLLEHLNSRQLDVMFILSEDIPDNTKYYEWQEVATIPIVAVVNRKHPLAGKDCLRVEDLEDEKLMVNDPGGSLSRIEKIRKFCLRNHLDVQNVDYMNNDLTVFMNAQWNRGIGLGVRGVFNPENDSVKIIDIQNIHTSIVAMWNIDVKEEVKALITQTFLHEFLEF